MKSKFKNYFKLVFSNFLNFSKIILENKTENLSSPYPRALYEFTALGLIWARWGKNGLAGARRSLKFTKNYKKNLNLRVSQFLLRTTQCYARRC
jgi:hypothetical protein